MNAPICPKRRWLRYSLRTFLVLLTALCIWMGILAEKAAKQKRAVEAVLARDGWVQFDSDTGSSVVSRAALRVDPEYGAAGPAWARKIVGEEFFRILVGVGIVTGEGDEFIAGLTKRAPNLKVLHLNGPNISNKALMQIASLRNLQSLYLICPKITSDGLSQLRPLRHLNDAMIFRDRDSLRLMEALEDAAPHVDFDNCPLSDVAAHISNTCNLPIRFSQSLGGREKEMSITIVLKNIPLGTALRDMLKEHHLGFFIDGKSVVIAAIKDCEEDRPNYRILRSLFPAATIETDG